MMSANFNIKLTFCSIIILLFLGHISSYSQKVVAPSLQGEQAWVDSVYNTLNLKQKIGQLIMLRTNSGISQKEVAALKEKIGENSVGGVCFFKGHPQQQYEQTQILKKSSSLPLMVAMDAEWGASMRLDSLISFPKQMSVGAVEDSTAVAEWSRAIAQQLNALGVNVCFSPVVDLNSNPQNPVINVRAFGENKHRVAKQAEIMTKILQENGIMSVAKHFPGHGDTKTDSHYELPVVNHDLNTILNDDIYPYRQLINNGIKGVMISHIYLPAIDEKPVPATLSEAIVTDILKEKLGFKGIIFTDGLEMKAVTDYVEPGKLELMAIKAGNDVLLLPVDAKLAVKTLEKAVKSGELPMSRIEESCKKVLSFKYYLLINETTYKLGKNVVNTLNANHFADINELIYSQSITLIKNSDDIVPVQNADTSRIYTISFSRDSFSGFSSNMPQNLKSKHIIVKPSEIRNNKSKILSKISDADVVIINVEGSQFSVKNNYGISSELVNFVEQIAGKHNTVLTVLGLPYAVSAFNKTELFKAIIVTYENNVHVRSELVKLIFGEKVFKGVLPVSINDDFPEGKGIKTVLRKKSENIIRFNKVKNNIENIIYNGISEKAFPGCQLCVVKDGEVLINKSYGTTDYENNIKVDNNHLYDIASVTKIMATTLAMMRLYDEGAYKLNDKLSSKLEFLKDTNLEDITFKQILSHNSGLPAWINFSHLVLNEGQIDTAVVKTKYSKEFPVKVAENMFVSKNIKQKIFDSILNSELKKKEYLYSDLGMILLKEFVEHKTKQPFDEYLSEKFYEPLGLKNTTFLPSESRKISEIIPTENDTIMRKQVICGTVHDPTAALMGGVSGHAGLFSNATDVAVVMQMLLQDGEYNGVQYINPITVKQFTTRYYKKNRRGLGFDMRQIPAKSVGPASEYASVDSFGHTGFTGTITWADPENNLIIVFLSNRVNPYPSPNKLVSMGIRSKIQDELYKAFK
ncbi:MAG: glycoside hydrolase family 3 N-terminal domain-containing protein [Bacteroidales bacterium]